MKWNNPKEVRPPNTQVHGRESATGRVMPVICNYRAVNGGGNPPEIEYCEVMDGVPPYRYPSVQIDAWRY